MAAPRPYETDPFHKPSSVLTPSYDQFLYIHKTFPVISSMWYLQCVLEHCSLHVYACALPELPISRLSTILKSIGRYVVRFGTKYSEIHRH